MFLSRFTNRVAALTAMLALAVAIMGLQPARAGTFEIDPTRLTFSTMTSGDVNITNVGQTPVRLSLRAYDWTQDQRNSEKLAPAKNVVYFPQLFTLAPGVSQRVRVGVLDTPAANERAYRLVVSELPSFAARGAAGTAGVTFLSRLDIPVLLAPASHAFIAPQLTGASVRNGSIDVALANTGTEHIEQSHVTIVARDASGADVWTATANAFYVLAHSRIEFSARAPQERLRRAASILVTWHVPGSAAVSRTFPLH